MNLNYVIKFNAVGKIVAIGQLVNKLSIVEPVASF